MLILKNIQILMSICRIQVSCSKTPCSKTQFQNPDIFCVFGFVENLSKSALIESENECVKVYQVVQFKQLTILSFR